MFFILLICSAFAHVAGFHDWPQQRESTEDISLWVFENDWFLSPVREIEYDGTRVGIFVDRLEDYDVSLEVRGVDGDAYGPWVSLRKEFEKDTMTLLVQDFPNSYSALQFRSKEPSIMQYLEWDLLYPANEQTQMEENPQSPTLPPPPNTYLPQSLIDIGVISRTQWGAQNTQCTSPEDTWYRMAIHHVASQQTYNGSVQDRLQFLQSWAMSSGGYCDIPYQYLVGYDGTLWEGRPINKYSGATGGGNNDGNIALSFIGCYDQSACQSSFGFYDNETDIMMARARQMIQTLSSEHGFAVNTTNIKAHKDWPNNSTVCPGNFIMNRFSELLSSVPYYYGQVGSQSHSGSISLTVGETVDVWVDVTNTGMWSWNADTKLAPSPRDIASSLSDSSWISSTRVQSVGSTVSPGTTHRFQFKLKGLQEGTYTQHFTMVQEWFTWFADSPFAGSPSDSGISFVVEVQPVPQPSSEPASEPALEPTSEPTSEPSSEIDNAAPIAQAGFPQEVHQGDMVYLSGQSSYDPEGQPLYYAWRFLEETDMVLFNSSTNSPYFEATEVGEWAVELVVFDGVSISSATVVISILPNEDIEGEKSAKLGCASTAQTSSFFLLVLLSTMGIRRRTRQR